MIILYLIFLLFISLLFIKFKISFLIIFENTKSHIEIKFLFYKYIRNGKFILKAKETKHRQSNKCFINKKSKDKEIKSSNKQNLKKIKYFFIRNVKYEKIDIYEKIGVLTPYITSIALPIVTIATLIPIKILNVNYNKVKYKIIPDYNNLIFNLKLKGIASFRIIDFLKKACIIKYKHIKYR